ncbi:hypothetical protein [Spirosoma luteum]|uniref:hypothetical protein n=1 Tax=Spirosoma luteum TaxID=431553 RepID=UPI0003651A68|nr:hypothetical protein [Spirosoma luteum]
MTQRTDINHRLFVPADVLLRLVWQARLRVVGLVVLCTMLGATLAWMQQPEFRSEARVMPEMNGGANDLFKRLSSVAGLTDIDFSEADGMDAIRPDLYPNVLQSTPFILYLIDQPVTTTTGARQTVGSFLLTGTSGWSFKKLLSLFRLDTKPQTLAKGPSGALQLSIQQQDLAEEIMERVNARLDARSGLITITAQMPDAYVAASVTQLAMTYLTTYVTNYRTEKARQDLAFYDNRVNEVRKRYQKAQFSVFHYNDNHKNLVMLSTTMDRQRMEAELTIAQTVYTELSRQLEQAKLKVQERTPIFKVLEPPSVPLKRTSPKRILTVLLFAGTGLLLGVSSVLIQQSSIGQKLNAIRFGNAPGLQRSINE